jgi:hypothetical protein
MRSLFDEKKLVVALAASLKAKSKLPITTGMENCPSSQH